MPPNPRPNAIVLQFVATLWHDFLWISRGMRTSGSGPLRIVGSISSGVSLLPRRGRRWPTGRMRALATVTIIQNSPSGAALIRRSAPPSPAKSGRRDAPAVVVSGLSEPINRNPFYTVVWLWRGEDRTDWKKAAPTPLPDGSDPDDAMEEVEWATTELPMPRPKTHASLCLDADVLDWFKSHGRSYQRRINAGLRSYFLQHTR